jgi:hypothetical protein
MNRTHRLRRWAGRSLLSLAVLGLLVVPVGHAQVVPTTPLPTPTPTNRVPEPDSTVLLLIGLGVTGLVGYYLDRRKHTA